MEVSLSPPARSAGGDGRTVVISLPLLFYYLIPLLSLPPSSIQKYFLMDLESISKGYRQSKSYFEGTHHLGVELYMYVPFSVPKQPKSMQNSPGASLQRGCVLGHSLV